MLYYFTICDTVLQENSIGNFVKINLTSLMAECAKSFERLPIVENADILRNIIYSGVWTRYEYLQLKNKKDLKEKCNDRSL